MSAKFTDAEMREKLWQLRLQMEELAKEATQTTDKSFGSEERWALRNNLEYSAKQMSEYGTIGQFVKR